MKLWLFSDLHLEFERHLPPLGPIPDADVCVVPGDILQGCANSIHWLAKEVSPRMPVVFVAGNHEFYGDSIVEGFEWGRTAAAEFPGRVHFLENDSVVIGGVRFLGCTLWTDYAVEGSDPEDVAFAMAVAEAQLNDHRQVAWRRLPAYEGFPPKRALDLHRRSRGYLDGQLAWPHDGPTVVVTHHAPHRGSIHARWKGSTLNACFASDLSELIEERKPDLWVHGHMHDSADYVVAGTRIVCNPKGYRSENARFDPRLILEV